MATSSINLPSGFKLETELPQGFVLEEPTFVESVKAGVAGAAKEVVESFTGLGRMAVETSPIAQLIPPPKREQMAENIKTAGENWAANINAYWKTHPDEFYAVKAEGALPVIEELLANPGKLVGGVIESVPLILAGISGGGTVGGIAAMTIPIAGEEYGTARDEGTPIMPALIRAISSGVGQAAIEQWSLGKKIGLAKMLPKGSVGKIAWEGVKAYARGYAEEGSQQLWSNFLKWLFTDREQNWLEGVKASAEMGGPLELAMAGGFAGIGAVDRQVRPAKKLQILENIKTVVQDNPTFKPEQVEEVQDEIKVQRDAVIDEYIEEIRDRFPQVIQDQTTLEEVGNAIAADFGMKESVQWQWGKGRGRIFGQHTTTGEGANIIKIFGNVHKSQQHIKETVVHELGHIAVPPIIIPGGKRKVHTPAFKQWVAEHEKLLTEIVKVPKQKKIFTGPAYRVQTGFSPEGTAADVVKYEQDELNNNLKVSKEKIAKLEKRPAKDIVWVGKTKEDVARYGAEGTIPTSEEIQNLPDDLTDEVKGGEIIAEDGEGGYLVLKPEPTKEYRAIPRKQRNKMLGFIHTAYQELDWSKDQYRDKLEELTGKRSAKDLTPEELQVVYDHFKELYGGDIELTDEDANRPITFMDQTTTMSKIMTDAIQTVNALPSLVTISPKIRRRVFGFGIKEKLIGIKDFFVGIDGSRPARLSKMLGGFKDTVLMQIFRDNLVERGANKKDAVLQNIHEEWDRFRQENNLTPEILAKFSATQAQHILPVEAAKEALGRGPDVVEVTFNGVKYLVTWDIILNDYLQLRQPDGRLHAEKNTNNKLSGKFVGALSPADIDAFIALAESNPLIVKIADWMENTLDQNYWKSEINFTSRELVGKDIATKKQWWTLDVVKTRRLVRGKQFVFKPSKLQYNAIEDRSFFQQRKGPTGGLDLDIGFFEKFSAINNAIAEYAAYAVPLKIARTVLANDGIVNSWRIKGYEKFYKHLDTILTNEIESSAPQGTLESVIATITRNAAKAVIWLNARTMGVQVSSIPLFLNHTSKEFVASGIKYAASTSLEKAAKITPWIWARYYMDIGPRQIGGIAEGSPNLVLQFQGKLPWAETTATGLKVTDVWVFKAAQGIAVAEYKAAQEGKLEPGSVADEYWKGKDVSFAEGSESWRQQINNRFTILKRGQQSWDKFDRSIQTSSKSPLSKMAFLFRSFTEGTLNVAQEAVDDWQHNGINPAPKLGTVVATYATEEILRWSIGQALIALLAGGMALLGRKREPQWLTWRELVTNMITGPLDLVPIVGRRIRNQIDNFVRILAKEKVRYTGRVTETLPLQVINLLTTAPDNFTNAIALYIAGENNKGDAAFKRSLGDLYEGLGLATGTIPTYEVKRVRKIIEGEVEGQPSGRRRRRRRL